MGTLSRIAKFYYTASHWPECLSPVFDLALAIVFGKRIFQVRTNQESKTGIAHSILFNDVYQVPIIAT